MKLPIHESEQMMGPPPDEVGVRCDICNTWMQEAEVVEVRGSFKGFKCKECYYDGVRTLVRLKDNDRRATGETKKEGLGRVDR